MILPSQNEVGLQVQFLLVLQKLPVENYSVYSHMTYIQVYTYE